MKNRPLNSFIFFEKQTETIVVTQRTKNIVGYKG